MENVIQPSKQNELMKNKIKKMNWLMRYLDYIEKQEIKCLNLTFI